MLYFIGLGLADEKDISVKGLEIVKSAARVYLEAYTAILLVGQDELESFYGRPVLLADREMVESNCEAILHNADVEDVAFLVVGDPFSATTHTDLVLRARDLGVSCKSIPNASILNAIGATGLTLYNFGQTVSLPAFTSTWRPTSFYDSIGENMQQGLHTLLLLDIKVKEPDWEELARGKSRLIGLDSNTDGQIPESLESGTTKSNAVFMTAAQAIRQLLEVEEEKQEGWCAGDKLVIAAARVGGAVRTVDGQITSNSSKDKAERFAVGTLSRFQDIDMGPPLHSLVLIGHKTHPIEKEMLKEWVVNDDHDNEHSSEDSRGGEGRKESGMEEFERVWTKHYAPYLRY